jgi:hypothetical protein
MSRKQQQHITSAYIYEMIFKFRQGLQSTESGEDGMATLGEGTREDSVRLLSLLSDPSVLFA